MNQQQNKSMPNYYLTLDIMPGASQNDILHAYNRAKMTYSSGSLASYSLLEDNTNTSILDEIEKAFEILGHPSRRREYDLTMGFSTWVDDQDGKPRGMPEVYSPVESRRIDDQHGSHSEKVTPFPTKSGRTASNTVETPSYEANPEFEQKVREVQVLDGAFIRAVRIYRNLTVEQLAARAKIAASRIIAIEEDDTSEHNQPVYLRGHVAILARMLDLPNPEPLAKSYLDRLRAEGKLPGNNF